MLYKSINQIVSGDARLARFALVKACSQKRLPARQEGHYWYVDVDNQEYKSWHERYIARKEKRVSTIVENS